MKFKKKPVHCRIHNDLYEYMENKRKIYARKGIKVGYVDLSKQIAENLKRKRKSLGLQK